MAICMICDPSPRRRTRSARAADRGGSPKPVSLGPRHAALARLGADIVVGEGQSFGNTLSFGRGRMSGLFATRQKYVRQMPGRLVGETVDAEGKAVASF